MRERLLEEKERSLDLRAELLERKGNGKGHAARISVRELQLWRRQAKTIGRSPLHLESIDDAILQATREGRRDFIEIPESDFAVRLLDQDEFNRRAFKLIEQLPEQGEK